MKKIINFKLENGDDWIPCSVSLKTISAAVGNDLARKYYKEVSKGDLSGYFEDKLWVSIDSFEGIEVKSLSKLKETLPQYVFDKLLDEMRGLEALSQEQAFRVEESDKIEEDPGQ